MIYDDLTNNELLEKIQSFAFEATDRELWGDADWYLDHIQYALNVLQKRCEEEMNAEDELEE